MKYRYLKYWGLALGAILQGCGSGVSGSTSVAQAIGTNPSCDSLRDRLFDELYRQVDRTGTIPDEASVASELERTANGVRTRVAMASLYSRIAGNVRGLDREEAMRTLAEMEIGDRTTEAKSARQDEVERRLASVRTMATLETGKCQETPPPIAKDPSPVPLFEVWRQTLPSPLYGAYKAFAVGYQSCNAVDLNPVSSSTGSVSGIVITGTHPNGVGSKREISDVDAVFRTNLYYANRVSPGLGCFTATNSPLIYDYGGKPYAWTSLGALDFSKNAGSGTSVLGVDCSGFVSAAILAGGLRLRSGSTSKPAQASGVSASMFADPKANGLSCFAPLPSTANQELRPGDIIANTGHVVMVDRTGADPLGIRRAKSVSECASLTSSGFDFTIIQSSPSKGGIGMNRYRASSYLSGSMRTGMEAYARSFCRARFEGKTETLANKSQAVVIRHTGTPACQDKQMPIIGESCLASCAPNPLLAIR